MKEKRGGIVSYVGRRQGNLRAVIGGVGEGGLEVLFNIMYIITFFLHT